MSWSRPASAHGQARLWVPLALTLALSLTPTPTLTLALALTLTLTLTPSLNPNLNPSPSPSPNPNPNANPHKSRYPKPNMGRLGCGYPRLARGSVHLRGSRCSLYTGRRVGTSIVEL